MTVCVCVGTVRDKDEDRELKMKVDGNDGVKQQGRSARRSDAVSCNKKMVKYVEMGGLCRKLTRCRCYYLAYIVFFFPWEGANISE